MALLSKGHMYKKSDESGFSLIEAMIAIVVFAIGILGAYALQIHATQGNSLANRVSTSATLASYAVEEILGRNYDDVYTGSGVGGLEEMSDSADGIIYVQPDGSILKWVYYVQPDGSFLKIKDPGAPGNPLYIVYYNIATGGLGGDGVLNEVKLIRTHVRRHVGVGKGHLYSHTYYKAKWPESDE